MINLLYTQDFLDDLEWLRKNNRKLFQKVRDLAKEIIVHPEGGQGRPERLKYYASVVYSRRIDRKNRLIYEIVDAEHVKMLRCLGHYDDK